MLLFKGIYSTLQICMFVRSLGLEHMVVLIDSTLLYRLSTKKTMSMSRSHQLCIKQYA